jgi:hypothetical protein
VPKEAADKAANDGKSESGGTTLDATNLSKDNS